MDRLQQSNWFTNLDGQNVLNKFSTVTIKSTVKRSSSWKRFSPSLPHWRRNNNLGLYEDSVCLFTMFIFQHQQRKIQQKALFENVIWFALGCVKSSWKKRRENSRRAVHLHKRPPHSCNLIGGEIPGAELKLVWLHVGLQFTAIFCTNSSSPENMTSFFEKHLIYPSNGVPKSMADLRRYEGFFPNMTGTTYDPISLMNEKNRNREPSSSFSSDSTAASNDDDMFSNTAFAFSR